MSVPPTRAFTGPSANASVMDANRKTRMRTRNARCLAITYSPPSGQGRLFSVCGQGSVALLELLPAAAVARVIAPELGLFAPIGLRGPVVVIVVAVGAVDVWFVVV